MALISDVIPSMLQGMTQQPPELRNPTQGDLQINGVSHPTYGLGKRAGTDHVRVLPGVPVRNSLWATWIARDDAEMYVVIFDGTRLRVFDMVGNEYPVYPDPGTLSYLLGGDPRRTLAALTLGDTTLILNRTKTVEMKSTKSAAQVHKAVVFVKRGEYGQKYILRIDGDEVSYTTDTSDVTTLQTSHIAEKLKTEIETHGTLSSDFTVTYTSGDSHFVVTKNGGADFDIEARDSIGGTALGMVKSVAPSFSDLPPIAPSDLVVRVAGTNADSADDYWVKYDPERASDPQGATRGRWVETIAPDTPYQLDGSTLPHRLVRLQDDVVGTVTNTPNQIYFKFQQVEWAERVVGDENVNPDPSFVGNQIQAMSLHQGRLVFAFKDRVVTSRTNDLFNFFRQTATQVLDDDPIDISVASQLPQGKVVNFRHALDYNDSLLMVADGAQALVTSGQEPLTPTTVRAVLNAAVDCDPYVRPIVVDASVIVPYTSQVFTGVWEYGIDGSGQVTRASRLSAAVPKLLRGRPLKIAAAPTESTLIVQTDFDISRLYVFRWLDRSNERVQASWGIWTFGRRVLAWDIIGSTLWLLVDRPEGACLESMEMEPWNQTEEAQYPILLDRKTGVGATIRSHGCCSSTAGQSTSGGTFVGGGSGGGGTSVGTTEGIIDNPPVNQPRTEDQETAESYEEVGFEEPLQVEPVDPSGTLDLFQTGSASGSSSGTGNEEPGSGGVGGVGGSGGGSGGGPVPPTGGTSPVTGGADSCHCIDSREVGSASYDPATNITTVTLPYETRAWMVVVRADTMQVVPWKQGGGPRVIELRGDFTAIPLYVGFRFEFRYRFGQATLPKPNAYGGVGVVQRGRLQLIDWQVCYNETGPIDLEVFRHGELIRFKRVPPRRLGKRVNNVPIEGRAKILVLGQAEDCRVDIINRTHWPSWFTSASWTAEFLTDTRL